MKYEIDYLPKKNIVHVKMHGRLNFNIAERYSLEALKLARENNCNKFLIDHSDTVMRDGANRTHATGEEFQQFGFKNTDQIAVVLTIPINESVTQKGDNINLRWSILKYFHKDNMQDAIDWLIGV